MALITNQWLKANPMKQRPHAPVPVTVSNDSCSDEWCRENGVIAGIIATRADGDYEEIYLTGSDMPVALPQLFAVADSSLKRTLALETLTSLSDSDLVALLAEVFTSRTSAHAADPAFEPTAGDSVVV